MTDGGFSNKPKILKGAFVEYGLSLPPQFVVFQFNPEQLTRARSVSFSAPAGTDEAAVEEPSAAEEPGGRAGANGASGKNLRDFHQREFEGEDNLLAIQKAQITDFAEESISFQVRLDATDRLNNADPISGEFGILPELSALEQMVSAKEDGLLGAVLDLFGAESGHSFLTNENPPVILFIWGYTRVLPVNLESLSITETEFNSHLAPTRATVDVSIRVIESNSIPYTYSKTLRGVMSALNLRNIADIANVVVPG